MGAQSFTIAPAADILAGAAQVPHAAGIYAALFPRGRELITEWAGAEAGVMKLGTLAGHPVFYVGSTRRLGLDVRIAHHVGSTARQSTLRRSLGLLLADELELTPVAKPGRHDFHFADGEQRLSKWIAANVLFAFRKHRDPRSIEQRMIRSLDPAMNILNRGHRPFARLLLDMRFDVWGPMIEDK